MKKESLSGGTNNRKSRILKSDATIDEVKIAFDENPRRSALRKAYHAMPDRNAGQFVIFEPANSEHSTG